jgi:hypothetical protein
MKSRSPGQADLFYKAAMDTGRQLRDAGKERLSERNQIWLARARATMVDVIRQKGECSSDDCWELCPPPIATHPSVMGCLFDDRRFVRIGDRLSKRPSAHARRISVYELKDEPNAGRD